MPFVTPLQPSLRCKKGSTVLLRIWIVVAVFALCSCVSKEDMQPKSDSAPAPTNDVKLWEGNPNAPSRQIVEFETSEGTAMNVDISPDGETLTFDLLGDVYMLPVEGGEAVPLTSGMTWDAAPRFSPDGKSVYFVSDRSGFRNIWRLGLDDQSLKQVTASDLRGTPNWSHNGRRLLVGRTDPDGNNVESILHSVDPITGEMTLLDAPDEPWFDLIDYEYRRPPVEIYSAVQTQDSQVYYARAGYDSELKRSVVRLYRFDLETKSRTVLTPLDAAYNEYKPQLSHNGELLAYFRQYADRRTEIRIRSIGTGEDEALIALQNADDAGYSASESSRPNYAFAPDDRRLIFWHNGKLHQVALADGSTEIIPFHVNVIREVWERVEPRIQSIDEAGEAQIIRWPSLSRDGRTMAFAAIGYVWIMDLATGEIRRLTDADDFEFMPDLSPDGRSVAYVSFADNGDEYWPGRLMVADIGSGATREILSAANTRYLLPKWSQDGQKLALIRETQNDDGLEAAFGWMPAENGAFHEAAPAPGSAEWLAFPIFSRFVGFDSSGDNLLFSFRSSGIETILAAVSLDGGDPRTLAIGVGDIGGITPAPDLKNLALTKLDGSVWVVPCDAGAAPVEVSADAPAARRVSENAGYYVGWDVPGQLAFGFGANLYRYDLEQSELDSFAVKVPLAKPQASRAIAFTGARLITLAGEHGAGLIIEAGTIVAEEGRIAALGSVRDVTIPFGARVIDARGKTIMPGLLDTHYHRIGGSGNSALRLPNPKFSDPTAIAYGVTSAWEPGGVANDGAPATADLQAAGRILGPRWSHSANGGFSFLKEPFGTYADARAAVERRQLLGAHVLKEYNTPSRTHRRWLSAAAREKGLGIVSHLQDFDGMMTRIVDGYSGGDHPHMPMPFYKDVEELLRQTGYIWTPNIVIASGTIGEWPDKSRYYWREALKRRPQELAKFEAMTSRDLDVSEPSVPYELHRASRVAKAAADAAKHGAHIGVSAHNMPGAGMHQEMWFLWKGGMAIEDVLWAATMGNAEKLGLQEEIGSLEVGKIADFLVLDENPLDDILNTLSLKYTVQGGVVYDSTTAKRVDVSALAEHPTDATVH